MITVLIFLVIVIGLLVEDEREGAANAIAPATATHRQRRAWNRERLDLNPAFRRSRP